MYFGVRISNPKGKIEFKLDSPATTTISVAIRLVCLSV